MAHRGWKRLRRLSSPSSDPALNHADDAISQDSFISASSILSHWINQYSLFHGNMS